MRILDVNVAVNEGRLLGAYADFEDAESRASGEAEDNFNYAVEEYDLDPDEDAEAASIIGGYDGGEPYAEQISIDVDDLDKRYETSEGDWFTGSELLEMYDGDAEPDCYIEDDDEDELDIDEEN